MLNLPDGVRFVGDGMRDFLTMDVTDLDRREDVLELLPQLAAVWVLRYADRVYVEWANVYSPESAAEILADALFDLAQS